MVLFVDKAAVLGAGIMGARIAEVLAMNNVQVTVRDVAEEALEKGRKTVEADLDQLVAFHAKKARGLMARWMADHRPRTLADLRGFDAEGYRISKAGSDDTMVFTRPRP